MFDRSWVVAIMSGLLLAGCTTMAGDGDIPPPPPPPPPPPVAPPPPPPQTEPGDSDDSAEVDWDEILGSAVGTPTPGGVGTVGTGSGGGGSGGSGVGIIGIGTIGSGGAAGPAEDPAFFTDECTSRGGGDRASGEGYSCITLLYGTNREPGPRFGALDEQEVYTARPDPVCEPGQLAEDAGYCHLGVVSVTVPDSRNRGDRINSVPRTATRVTDRQRRNRFSIWNYEEIDAARFATIADQMLADAMGEVGGEYDNQVIVFVHGFNVRFRDAAFRAAQIKYDLDFPGPVFFYSWPANGSIMHYLADMDDADLSVDGLVDFLQLVRASVPDAEINLIAHSMGTRVFAQALNRLAFTEPDYRFNHVFFASGDLDQNLFVEWVRPAASMMESVTLYTSGSDVAVASSQLLRNLFPSDREADRDRKARIGFYARNTHPPVFDFTVGANAVLPQTIDMTRTRMSFFGFATRYLLRRANLGHSDYMERTPIIDDMSCILRHGARAPDARHSGMQSRNTDDDATYWRFDEDGLPTAACPPPVTD